LAGGLLVAILTALACVWGLVRYTRTSPRFAVRTLQIDGAVRRSNDEIARLCGLSLGQNIFSIDLETGRNAILGDPWIERATVTRRLPGTVQIEIVEREATALVAVGAELYLSTRQGELFKKPEEGDPVDLPVVTGCKPEDVAKDRATAVSTIKRALDLVADYERTLMARTLPVQEVHVDDDGALVLSVGKSPILLHLGKGPYRQPLEQVTRVMNEIANRRAEASNVFVDNDAHPERVVVRMR
jgi:cell division protein FtsQ